MQHTGLQQPLHDELNPAGLVEVGGHESAARLQVGQQRRALTDPIEVINVELNSQLTGDGEQMQDGIGGAAGRRDGGDGVLERVPGDDLAWTEVAPQQIHHQGAGAKSHLVLLRMQGRHRGAPGEGDPQELADRGQRVGGELAPAGPCAGTGHILQLLELGIRQSTRGVGPDRLEDILNRHIAPVVSTGRNRSPVEHQAGDIQPGQRHDGAWDGLVAASQRHQSIEHVAESDQLDGIRNDLSADQGGLHPLGAHGDAVRDRDGVELHGRTPGGANPLLHLGRQPPQVKVARPDLNPGVGDPHDRPSQVLVAESHRLEHGSRRGTAGALGDGAAASFQILGHRSGCPSSRSGCSGQPL